MSVRKIKACNIRLGDYYIDSLVNGYPAGTCGVITSMSQVSGGPGGRWWDVGILLRDGTTVPFITSDDDIVTVERE